MADVFPRRDLALSEYWGRTVENRILELEKTHQNATLELFGANRANTVVQSDLSQTLSRLQDQLIKSQAQFQQTQALAAALPETGSTADYRSGFGLGVGWQRVAYAELEVPPNKTKLSVIATGVGRVVDPGTGGTNPGGGFRWPFPTSTVTSEYGPRDGRMHQGIDFGVPQGTPIPASNSGTISGNGFGSGTGWYVDINHGNGIRTRNFHLVAQSDVAVGTQVAKGQTVGLVGNTGNSFGAHLHWETIVNGVHQNPRDFMALYGDGGNSSPTPSAFGRPKARMLINGNYSREFFPHRDFTPNPAGGAITLNQLFPQHGVDLNDTYVYVAFDMYAEANVPSDPGNFARLTISGVFSP